MAAGAELLRRIWVPEIQNQLFTGSSFINRSVNDDAYVNANTVELSHSGTIPAVTVDRSSLPATVSKRTDAATNYTLSELTTDPTVLQYSEELLVSYPKRQSIVYQHIQSLRLKCANLALYNWAGGADSTRIIASTGSNRAAGNTTGAQTGNRKAFTESDIIGIQRLFFADAIVPELDDIQGVAVVTPSQYSDLLKIASFVQAQIYGSANIPSGVMRRAYGFDFYVRQTVVSVDASNALRTEGAAGATDTQDTAIFYSPQYVRKALGSVIPFLRIQDPLYYGDIMNVLIRFGSKAARNDNKGVYLLYEDN